MYKKNDFEIFEIFNRFSKLNENPKTELNYNNEFTFLIAVVMSAQSTDKQVNVITKNLFKEINSPQDVLSIGLEGLTERIKSIGLYNAKSKNIFNLSAMLVAKFNSAVPSSFEDLTSLPGVGAKSANLVLNTIFGKPSIAVDRHVMRVSNRIGLSDASDAIKVEKDLIKLVPDKWKKNSHHWLVLHGRYICKSRKPLCAQCPIIDICQYDKKNI